ncbi:MAG: MarR family winged helix-turn-helix transcriptional regulator [Myxococcales bacterium]
MREGNRELAELIQRLNTVLSGREAVRSLALLQRSGLGLPQVVALYVLAGAGPRSMSQLAAALHLSLAATSQLVDKLVEAGLVARAEAKGDRRFKTVTLLKLGRKTLDALHRARAQELSASLTKLPREVQHRLGSALEAALAYLEDGRGERYLGTYQGGSGSG